VTGTLLAIESVVLVLLTILVAGLLRSHAEILKRLHTLGAGLDDDPSAVGGPVSAGSVSAGSPTRPPGVVSGNGSVADIDGVGVRDDDVVHVAVAGARHQTLLAFLTSGCLTCRGFWDSFRDLQALDLPADLRLVIVAKDASEESITALRQLAPAHVAVVMSSSAWAAYGVPGSPYFVLVDGPEGRVRGEGTGASWDQVWNLLRQSEGDSREHRIDAELLSHGIAPGDPSLYRTAEQIAPGAPLTGR
jgi:hypothetical protein